MTKLVYFSSAVNNAERFIKKLSMPACRVPLHLKEGPLRVGEECILVVPAYGGGNAEGTVPEQVTKFLNDKHSHSLIRGAIPGGNMSFGTAYGLAGDIIAAECHVPHIYRFELLGTPLDVVRVREGLEKFWQRAR